MKLKSILCALVLLCLSQPLCAKAPKDKTKPVTIRFMDFNIADGMWWDQFNNYDRFVQWMQAQKIDIFAVCEAATHWDRTRRMCRRTMRYATFQANGASWLHAGDTPTLRLEPIRITIQWL